MPGPKRNGVINWVMGAIMITALLAILGLAFSNQSKMSEHRAAREPHSPIAVQLDNIEEDVTWIREKLEED